MYVGTLLAFLFFNFSDGVICFRLIFCVFFFGVGPSASMRVPIWTHMVDIFSHVIIFSIFRKGSPSSP